MWSVIRHIESAGLIQILDRGRIPQNLREAEVAIKAACQMEIDTHSPNRQAERSARRRRAFDVQLKRQRSVKARRWANLSKFGKA